MDASLRARVKRLLDGDIRVDDITRLFLYARDRSGGREPVEEVGDFVAHHDERYKGLVTRTTRDWHSIARTVGEGMNGPFDAYDLPSTFPDYLAANLRRQPKILNKKIGLTRKEAEARLPSIINNFIYKPTGRLAVSLGHSWRDVQIIEALSATYSVVAAFDDARLCKDFTATLAAQGLLQKDETKKFQEVYPAITLYAVSVMHNCQVVLPDESVTKLVATCDAGGYINVNAPVRIPSTKLTGNDHFFLSTAIFKTALPPSFCEPNLIANPTWDFFVELNPNMRLARLG